MVGLLGCHSGSNDRSTSSTDARPDQVAPKAPEAALATLNLGPPIARKADLAFASTESGFSGGTTLYSATIKKTGAFSVRPFDAGTSKTARPDPRLTPALELETTAVQRGAWTGQRRVADARPKQADARTLQISRSGTVEEIENEGDGIEQRWAFAERPSGVGDLQVRVRASGLTFVRKDDAGLHFADAKGVGIRYSAGTWIDAAGKRTPIDVNYANGEITLLVSSALVDASPFPAMLDPKLGPEFATGTPLASVTSDQIASPQFAMTADSSGSFLVYWIGTDGVYVTKVDGTGKPVELGGRVLITFPQQTTINSVVTASDGSNTFVVIGAGGGIYGALFDSTGTEITTSLASISANGTSSKPAVAYGGGKYEVVWQDSRTGNAEIYGGRVSATGTVLDPSGVNITNSAATQSSPQIAFGGSTFLVTWLDSRTGSNNIYGARVATTGLVTDATGIAVTNTTTSKDPASLVYGGTDFMVTWADSGSNVLGARIGTNGALTDTTSLSLSVTPSSKTNASIAVSGGAYLVSWQQYNGTSYDAYGAKVSTAGSVAVADIKLGAASATGNDESSFVAFNGTTFLAGWSTRNTNVNTSIVYNIKGARVSTAGVALDATPLPLVESGNSQTTPAVASNGTSHFVVWEDDRNGNYDIYGTRVDATGTVLDPDGIAICTAVNNQARPRVAFDGTNYLVVWQDGRTATDWNIYATRVTPAGVVVDAGGIAVTTHSGDQTDPALAFDGTNYTIVWSDAGQAANVDIYGARVSKAGTVIDSTAVAFSEAPGDQLLPRIAFDGTNYLVVWESFLGANLYDVGGVLISKTATLVVAEFPIANSSTAIEGRPQVAFGGADYLVAWEDDRNDTGSGTRQDIFARRIGTNGIPKDATNIAVESGMYVDFRTAVGWDGTNYLVLWTRFDPFGPNNAYEVLSQFISPAGVPRFSDGVSISTAPTRLEYYPELAFDTAGRALVAYIVDLTSTAPTNAERVMARYVSEGTALGLSCSSDLDCDSGFCADGVCCDQACGGTDATDCQSCSLAAGATADGTCTMLPSTVTCRAAVGVCDFAEKCSGFDPICPSDFKLYDICRAGNGQCNASEYCDGVSNDCPADTLAPSGTVCRAAADSCDIAETCNGTTATCPTNTYNLDTTSCDDSNACSPASTCVSGVCTPTTPVCPPADECHVTGSCQGVGTCVPVNAPNGTACSTGTCQTGVCTAVQQTPDAGVPMADAAMPPDGSPPPDGGTPDNAADNGGGGCCSSTGSGGAGNAFLGMLGAALLLRRRRRRSA
jgi:MYXO-CTERM domain-containing protein